MSAASILQTQVIAVCPITGVSVGDVADRTTWRVDYDPSATQPQRDAAANVVATFDLATAVTNETQRLAGISADTDLIDMWNRLHSATNTQIKNYVNNNSTADAGTKLILAKILLLLARG